MLGIIGCGNMANAIVRGFHQKDPSQKFLTYSPSFNSADKLAEAVGGRACKSLSELQEASSILVACKPQQLGQLAIDVEEQGLNLANKHIISILAAISFEALKGKLKSDAVSRVMPNTPALLGEGMSLVMHSKSVDQPQRDLTDRFFTSCGKTLAISNETLFDKVTTVTGSGPAYVFLFAQSMVEKLKTWGLDDKQARAAVVQLFQGSSALMQDETDTSLQQLIDRVTSKGGVTIEAVNSYRRDSLDAMTDRALDKAYQRSQEMTKLFSDL